MRFLSAALSRLTIAAALWAAVVVSGQELSRTQITDTLFNADGSRAEGSIQLSWKSFTAVDGSTVSQNKVDVDVVDGIVTLALTPNEGATPEGTAYRVQYRLRGGERFTELWVVPDSTEAVSIADIRVLNAPPVGTAVSMSQVSGLPSALSGKADKAVANTFTAPQILREDAPGGSNPLLGLEKNNASAGVYFRLPPLESDVTFTLPPNAGSPNQALTTDGMGALFWSSSAGAGSGTAYEVLQQAGTSVTQRTVANFTTGFTVSDNSGQLRTDIAPNFGTAAGTITQGNDSRLSDARTPLAHASTHAAAGSDPVTPLSIGALNRTNDFMVGTSPTTAVLKVQGATGQAAALQEWRDGSGSLAALVTASGTGFFREMGLSAPTGGTTVSQLFEVGGLKKFALSATDSAFDILRYDNSGVFLDRPFRVLRNGNIETTTSVKVADAVIGSGALRLTGNYFELQGVAAPSNPTSGFGRVFLNSTTGEVSVKKSSGSIVSLEGGGGGGDFLGNFASPTELTLSSGSVTFSGSGPHVLDTQSNASTDDWTSAVCAAGNSFSVRAENDARTVVIKGASIPTPTASDLSLDQDGDFAIVVCQTANSPEVVLFVDEDGQELYKPVDGGKGLNLTTTRPPGSTRVQLSRHVNACQDLTDGRDGEVCRQENTNQIFVCDTDNICDSAGEWVAFVRMDVATTKGDVLVFDGFDYVRLPAGDDDEVLMADASQSAGVKWAAGLKTVLDSAKNASAPCAGSSSWATLLSLNVPSGTLAAADAFEIEAQASATTPTSNADIQLLLGGNVVRLSGGVDAGVLVRASCYVLDGTSIHCGEQTFWDANTNESGNATHSVSSLSTNALTIDLQYRNCASDSSLTGHYLYAVQKGI